MFQILLDQLPFPISPCSPGSLKETGIAMDNGRRIDDSPWFAKPFWAIYGGSSYISMNDMMISLWKVVISQLGVRLRGGLPGHRRSFQDVLGVGRRKARVFLGLEEVDDQETWSQGSTWNNWINQHESWAIDILHLFVEVPAVADDTITLWRYQL